MSKLDCHKATTRFSESLFAGQCLRRYCREMLLIGDTYTGRGTFDGNGHAYGRPGVSGELVTPELQPEEHEQDVAKQLGAMTWAGSIGGSCIRRPGRLDTRSGTLAQIGTCRCGAGATSQLFRYAERISDSNF